MQTLFYNIGGIDLAPVEVAMLATMLAHVDHTYVPEGEPDDLDRQSLDILVLEGLIERFQQPDGTWLNGWVITDAAREWMRDPLVEADIELAKGLLSR